MGLHRRQNLIKLFADEDERNWAVKLFWSVYVLDRRWSFGTGIPFALQDADIDPALPEPVCMTDSGKIQRLILKRMALLPTLQP